MCILLRRTVFAETFINLVYINDGVTSGKLIYQIYQALKLCVPVEPQKDYKMQNLAWVMV